MQQQPNPVDESKLQTYADAEKSRIQAYKAARDAYNGIFTDQTVRRVGDINDRVKVNRVKPIVSATVNFLFGSPPLWELPSSADGENAAQDSSAEEWLKECLRVNQWEQLLLDLGINGGLCGTPYLAIDLSNLIPNPANPLRGFPRLHVLDPADMSLRWDPMDIDRTTGYIWQYNTYDRVKRATMVVRRIVELREDGRWWVLDQRSYSPNLLYRGDWITDGEVAWPFDWSPILHCKNLPCPNEAYGEPDITPTIVELNKARNLNLSNWSRIVRKHAQPKPWVKGMAGKRIDLDSEVIDMPSKDAEIGQLTPVVDGASSETLGRVIDEAICEESQTPSLVLGRPDQQGIPSGVALRIKLWPLLNKTETKRALYGPMLVEAMRRLLEAGGWGKGLVPVLKWAEMVPTDPKEEREVIQLDLGMGIASKHTAAQKLGYDYDQELANMQQEGAGSQVVSTAQPGGAPGQVMAAAAQVQQGQPGPGAPRSQAEIEQQLQERMQQRMAARYQDIAQRVGNQ